MRNSRPCSLGLFALACILAAGHLWGQQFDPGARFEVPDRVPLSENTLWLLLTNRVLPSYPVDAQAKGIQGKVVLSSTSRTMVGSRVLRPFRATRCYRRQLWRRRNSSDATATIWTT